MPAWYKSKFYYKSQSTYLKSFPHWLSFFWGSFFFGQKPNSHKSIWTNRDLRSSQEKVGQILKYYIHIYWSCLSGESNTIRGAQYPQSQRGNWINEFSATISRNYFYDKKDTKVRTMVGELRSQTKNPSIQATPKERTGWDGGRTKDYASYLIS